VGDDERRPQRQADLRRADESPVRLGAQRESSGCELLHSSLLEWVGSGHQVLRGETAEGIARQSRQGRWLV